MHFSHSIYPHTGHSTLIPCPSSHSNITHMLTCTVTTVAHEPEPACYHKSSSPRYGYPGCTALLSHSCRAKVLHSQRAHAQSALQASQQWRARHRASPLGSWRAGCCLFPGQLRDSDGSIYGGLLSTTFSAPLSQHHGSGSWEGAQSGRSMRMKPSSMRIFVRGSREARI